MITPSYSLSANSAILPSMFLDFTTGTLDARVSLTRANNTGTRVNSSGYIETINANLPRFDYNPVTLVANGLLIEEQRTNLLLYSEQADNTGKWTRSSVAFTANAINSPANTLTADLIKPTVSSAVHDIEQVITQTPGTTYSFSCYVKPGTLNYVSLFCYTASGTAYWFEATFDLSNGTVSKTGAGANGTYASSSINAAGNGWYRISVSGSISAGTSVFCGIKLENTATPTYGNYGGTTWSAAGTETMYLWGAQFEAGTFPTSYIPTTSATAQRNADVAVMTGTNFSNWWIATTGAAAVKFIPGIITGTRSVVQFDDNTANNIITLRGNTANSELYIKATSDQAQIVPGTIAANTAYGLAGAWNTNNCAAALSAGSVGTDTSATIPVVTQARIGCDGTNYLNGSIQTIRYWPQRIINNEIQAFSK